MVTPTNKLAHLPETIVYVDFGREQVDAINERFETWLAQQAFGSRHEGSRFTNLTVSGDSEAARIHSLGEVDDKVEWDLRFSDQLKEGGLSDALLHIKRLPNVTTFNSKPGIFKTANYIQIRVGNGERGWVKEGLFPVNVHMVHDAVASGREPMKNHPDIPAHTDIRREALAGFNAALYWQRFRAMAVASSGFMKIKLTNEAKGMSTRGSEGYDAQQHRRSRHLNVWPLYVEMLPDTRLDGGPKSLKPFYDPGTLEGTLALEIEHTMSHQFGIKREGEVRPVFNIYGRPIEIVGDANNYDAVLKFQVQMCTYGNSENDEAVTTAVQEQLEKHYSVNLRSSTTIDVAFELSNAGQVARSIRDGATDTKLHQFAKNFGDALRDTSDLLKDWYETEVPTLKREYETMVGTRRAAHFSELSTLLTTGRET